MYRAMYSHPFKDRFEAGRKLAKKLHSFSDPETVVLALPRGGVPVGAEIARELHVPLSVVVAQKLGAPQNPEFGFGAVTEGGVVVVDPRAAQALGIDSDDLLLILEEECAEMERRISLYRGRDLNVKNKTVILADDGIATGTTARAAIRYLRSCGVKKIILASPVCSQEAALNLGDEADDVICLLEPKSFYAVGQWYEHFPQLTDNEVIALLSQTSRAEAKQEHAHT